MSDVLVRGVEESALKRLRQRAKQHSRSLQAEIRLIIEQAAAQDEQRERTTETACRIKEELRGRPAFGEHATHSRRPRPLIQRGYGRKEAGSG